jgi:hypothetical protein
MTSGRWFDYRLLNGFSVEQVQVAPMLALIGKDRSLYVEVEQVRAVIKNC